MALILMHLDVLLYDASIVSGNGELSMSDNLLLFNPESNWNGNVEIFSLKYLMENIL